MADVAAPQGAEKTKQQVVKPEKPDQEKYQEELAKAEKEHAAAQDKFVCTHWPLSPNGWCAGEAIAHPVASSLVHSIDPPRLRFCRCPGTFPGPSHGLQPRLTQDRTQ